MAQLFELYFVQGRVDTVAQMALDFIKRFGDQIHEELGEDVFRRWTYQNALALVDRCLNACRESHQSVNISCGLSYLMARHQVCLLWVVNAGVVVGDTPPWYHANT